MNTALYPSRAISDPLHLKGRTEALRDAKQALSAPGRQLFVHGFRGVGKSSVALTAAQSLSAYAKPALIFCSAEATFYSIIRDICAASLKYDPLASEVVTQTSLGGSATLFGVGANGELNETKKYNGAPTPTSLNEAADLIRKVAPLIDGQGRTFIIDEFDLLKDPASHQLFGAFVKLLADSSIPAQLIFCGVAESLEEILKAHGSTFRYFHPLKLDRLKIQPCLDILTDAEKAVGVEIEHNSKMRIARICDGFPYFVHLIAEKLLWQWFNDAEHTGMQTLPRHYESALLDASNAAEPELRNPYDRVSHKYKLDGEIILWAVAEGDQLRKNLDMLEKDFVSIYERTPDQLKPPERLNRNQINSRLAAMKKPEYAHILSNNGRGWYEYTEKRMRGYARLRAAAKAVELKSDHPLL
ncbi:MAG: ATP-binding protein [Brevundimonas sp.]|nr:ATP-binding protein [Brevundimonas sp.]